MGHNPGHGHHLPAFPSRSILVYFLCIVLVLQRMGRGSGKIRCQTVDIRSHMIFEGFPNFLAITPHFHTWLSMNVSFCPSLEKLNVTMWISSSRHARSVDLMALLFPSSRGSRSGANIKTCPTLSCFLRFYCLLA
jgi:NADH:ubiquinone oxidoreductase subunit